jgi:hypothetical protein
MITKKTVLQLTLPRKGLFHDGFDTFHSHTLPLHSVFYAHNAETHDHMLILTEGGNQRTTHQTISIHISCPRSSNQ